MTQVLVTIGQQLPFDRLIEIADQCAAARPDWRWTAQIGRGAAYEPRHMQAVEDLDQQQFDAALAAADLLICHAGIGTVMRALTLSKPVVVMARDAARGEHRNQHQQATLEKLRPLPGIYPVADFAGARAAIDVLADRLARGDGSSLPLAFETGGADPRLLAMVSDFIREAMDRG